MEHGDFTHIELPASHFRVDLSPTALRAQGLTLG